MKKKRTQGLLAVAILAASLWSGPVVYADETVGQEVKIEGSQSNPSGTAGIDLTKDYAVWVSTNDDDDEAIVIYGRKDDQEVKVAANGNKKSYVKVSGNYLVWLEDSNNRKDIYLYDISSKKQTKITGQEAKPTELEFDGSHIVWTDERGGQSNIYSYDLAKKSEQKISSSNTASSPDVNGSWVVWEDERNGNSDIYAYNFDTKKEKRATTNKYEQSNPAVDRGVVVYEDRREGVSHIYSYDLDDGGENQITDSDEDAHNPQIYGRYVVYEEDDHLYYYNTKSEKTVSVESKIYSRVKAAIYDEDIFYVTKEDDKLYLNLYNIDDDEAKPFGDQFNDPSQPDASDKYVVFMNNDDQVILYEVATKKAKVISKPDQEPTHPVVSDKFVVWYDQGDDSLYSYNTKSGTIKKITKSSEEPSYSLYEIDGSNLFWVDEEGRSNTLKLTNLSTGNTDEIESTRKDIRNVDICGDRVLWVTDEGDDNSMIYYYDFKNGDDIYEVRHEKAEMEDAHLSENYIVWAEKDNTWDLNYYDFDRDRIYSVLQSKDKDQVRPQISRDFLLFEDNQYNRDNKFDYKFYDLAEMSYSDLYFSDDAVPTEVRLGGNRMVWIDERDNEKVVYMMAVAQPRDSDDPGNGEMQEYTLEELIETDKIGEILEDNAPENVVFVFYANTSKEIKYNLVELSEHIDEVIQLIETIPLDEIIVRVLP